MARGKHTKSAIHRANDEAQARIAELETEVERLHAIENVGMAHVQALGEIERLTRRVVELDGVARERDRLVAMLDKATTDAKDAKEKLADLHKTHEKVLEIALEAAPAGTTGTDRIDWLIGRLGHRGRMVNSPHLKKMANSGMAVPGAIIDVINSRTA